MAKKTETTQEQVQEQAAKQTEEKPAVNYADIIRDSLMKTKREGIVDLLDYMNEIGFLEAPCSGGNHLAKKGGLAEHSVNVLTIAEKIFKFHSVPISTPAVSKSRIRKDAFKFHSVPISTRKTREIQPEGQTLNSTLFLYQP